MFKVENQTQFNEGLDRWVDAMDSLATGVLRGTVVQVFRYILRGTPQWSGRLAANWYLSIGRGAPFYDPNIRFNAAGPMPDALQKGDPQAIAYAEANNRTVEKFTRLGADVVISNRAPYGQAVEENKHEKDGRAFLRPVNLPVEMVMAAYDKFGQGREISTVEAVALGEEKL